MPRPLGVDSLLKDIPDMLSHVVFNIFICLLSIVLMWSGANFVVTYASIIARRFNISELVIGLTVVAMGTSAPELLVTATAAFKGYEDIALSNIVGSNVFNLGIILGLMAFIKPLPTNKTIIFRDGLILFGVFVLIFILILWNDLTLNRAAGGLLFLILIVYISFLLVKKEPIQRDMETLHVHRNSGYKNYIFLALGFGFLGLGGNFMVESATNLAKAAGVSSWIIGMTIVAGGTSFPELVTCLAASIKGRNHMLLGNLIGSDMFNFAGVLGITCIMRPIHVSPLALQSFYGLIAMMAVILIFMRTRWKIGRVEGFCLIMFGFARWLIDFYG